MPILRHWCCQSTNWQLLSNILWQINCSELRRWSVWIMIHYFSNYERCLKQWCHSCQLNWICEFDKYIDALCLKIWSVMHEKFCLKMTIFKQIFLNKARQLNRKSWQPWIGSVWIVDDKHQNRNLLYKSASKKDNYAWDQKFDTAWDPTLLFSSVTIQIGSCLDTVDANRDGTYPFRLMEPSFDLCPGKIWNNYPPRKTQAFVSRIILN